MKSQASCLLKEPKPVSLAIELAEYHVPLATFDSEAHPFDLRCVQGTRVKVLNEAMRIIITRDGSHVIWISGAAGTGKTSIALSLCDILAKEPNILLGGTFFLSRAGNSTKRTSARYVVPTLATLLVRSEPACKEALIAELRRDPDFFANTIKHQIDSLLIKPLNSLKPIDILEPLESQNKPSSSKPLEDSEPVEGSKLLDRQVVFVIDGVDQCKDEKLLRELVSSLAEFK